MTADDWPEHKENFMLEILEAKAQQCEIYHKFLIGTDKRPLHEATSNKHWGGRPGCSDRLGKLHMQIRNQIAEGKLKLKEQTPPPNKPPNEQRGSPRSQHQKPTVTIMGDSNLTYMDPQHMTRSCKIDIVSAKTTEQANLVASQLKSDIVVIHTGTNDLAHIGAQSTAKNISNTVDKLLSKGTKVIISKLLPRGERSLNEAVYETNKILQNKYSRRNDVIFTNNSKFYDNGMPKKSMYYPEGRPLLHISDRGLVELSRQIQNCIRHYTNKLYVA